MEASGKKSSTRITPKERKHKHQYAKLLRDMMLDTFESWSELVDKELTDLQVEPQSKERIMGPIQEEVHRSLVWKVLAKEDRYDTPYYRRQLQELMKLHPDLTVENNYHCFVSWPVFNQADIERAFSNDYEALKFDKEFEESGS